MDKLTSTDLRFVVSRLPRDVRRLLQTNTLFLAGGFIRSIIAGENVHDIDILGPDPETLENIANKFSLDRGAKVHKTQNALTVLGASRSPVQFITRWRYSDPALLLSEFDFTIAQAVIWFEKPESAEVSGRWCSLCAPSYYADLAARRLVYTAPKRAEDVGGSLLRAIKFVKRGYNIQMPSLAAVVSRLVAGLNLKKSDDSTVTHTFFNAHGTENGDGQFVNEEWATPLLVALLHEVDPLAIIDGLETVDDIEA